MTHGNPARQQIRKLTARTQWSILAGAAALGALVLAALPGGAHPTENGGAVAEAALAPGSFRATEAQWAGLTIEPARSMVFRPIEETDGKIATNDDATTPVFSPYSGRVTKVFAKAGDMVQAGAPLLAGDASEFVQGQNDLVAALSQVSTARAQAKLAEAAEKRQHDLFEAGGGAMKDWQQSQSDLASARGTLRTAEIALAASRNRLRILGKSDTEISAVETAPDNHKISREAIIHAPIGGTVVQRQVGVGQFITSASGGGGTPVFAIGDQSTVWLVANVREADAPLIRGSEAIEVAVLAYPGRVFRARLSYVAPSIDPATRRLPVRAVVDNHDHALKPEMFARFRIVTGEENNAVGVPESAVVFEGENARVWVAGEDRSLALRKIIPGRSHGGMLEVVSGLEPDEKIVTSGSLFIDRAAKGG